MEGVKEHKGKIAAGVGIVLVVLLIFLLIWFLVIKKKPVTVTGSTVTSPSGAKSFVSNSMVMQVLYAHQTQYWTLADVPAPSSGLRFNFVLGDSASIATKVQPFSNGAVTSTISYSPVFAKYIDMDTLQLTIPPANSQDKTLTTPVTLVYVDSQHLKITVNNMTALYQAI